MTTITREHLELAALAAGMTYKGDQWSSLAMTGDGVWQSWRPHTDIAEAARLAVHIGARVDAQDRQVRASAIRGNLVAVDSVPHDGTQPDKERAYCEAVTLCAAQIGRRMREGQP